MAGEVRAELLQCVRLLGHMRVYVPAAVPHLGLSDGHVASGRPQGVGQCNLCP
jgi:hypothetical protein